MSESIPVRVSGRKPWLAVVLSLALTGLGHVYSGRPWRGALAWVLGYAVATLGLFFVVRLPSAGAWIVFGLFVAGTVVSIAADAWKAARAAGPAYQLRHYNRWFVYVGVVALSAFVVDPQLALMRGAFVGRTGYRVPSNAMAPLYRAGDWLVIAPLQQAPQRGDVVAYQVARNEFIRRIVGVPGDTIEMRASVLVVNGRSALEPYETHSLEDRSQLEFGWQNAYLVPGAAPALYKPSLHSWGPLLVPARSYFILGDNRDSSLDSRYLGFISQDSIRGRPVLIYFSWSDDSHSPRWGRVGVAR